VVKEWLDQHSTRSFMTRQPNPFDARIENVCERIASAQATYQQRGFSEAREEFLELFEEAKSLGLSGGDIILGLGCCSDSLRDFPAAIAYCRKALEIDPLSPSYRRSWGIVVGRIRAAILDEARPLDDAETLTLCRLLAQHGAADVPVHLRHARVLLKTGNVAEAKAVAMALAKLAPFSEVWAVLAHIALVSDDGPLAEYVNNSVTSGEATGLPFVTSQPMAQA
jgi:hypothetical protein